MCCTVACLRLTWSVDTQIVQLSPRPIDTSCVPSSKRRPMSPPEMITRHGGPEASGRSDGIEMAVRRLGKIDVMRRRAFDGTRGRQAVKSAAFALFPADRAIFAPVFG